MDNSNKNKNNSDLHHHQIMIVQDELRRLDDAYSADLKRERALQNALAQTKEDAVRLQRAISEATTSDAARQRQARSKAEAEATARLRRALLEGSSGSSSDDDTNKQEEKNDRDDDEANIGVEASKQTNSAADAEEAAATARLREALLMDYSSDGSDTPV